MVINREDTSAVVRDWFVSSRRGVLSWYPVPRSSNGGEHGAAVVCEWFGLACVFVGVQSGREKEGGLVTSVSHVLFSSLP